MRTSRLPRWPAAAAFAAAVIAAVSGPLPARAAPDTPPEVVLTGGAAQTPSAAKTSDTQQAYDAALVKALAIEDGVVKTAERIRHSSVTVIAKVNQPAAAGTTPGGAAQRLPAVPHHQGSGVLVSYGMRTWVLTNDHVAADCDALEVVTSDGKAHSAALVDTIQQYDIALLRITSKAPGLRPVQIVPRASRELQQGQWVIATGNPFFLAQDGTAVVTVGVISGLDRVLGGEHLYAGAVQHDAAVNPGNSGGPLWNTKGELIGINGMIATRGGGGVGASSTGASFSIPVDQIEPYLRRLADAKLDAQAGTLGVDTRTSTDDLGTPNGARVERISTASPVRSGKPVTMEVGDVIVAVIAGGKTQQVRTASDVLNLLTVCPADTAVRIRFRRGAKELTWAGKLAPEE